MASPSQSLSFDGRLLAIEELFRQHQNQAAITDLSLLTEAEFAASEHELGLFLLLQAEKSYIEGHYRQAIESGLKAARILADLPLNRRYGAVQRHLSKSYSAVGDLRNADIRARDALAAFRRASDQVGQVDSLNELGRVAFIRSEYRMALGFLTEALELVQNNPRKRLQIVGNIGRIRLQLGEWPEAETALTEALSYSEAHNEEFSQAANLLSLGYLALRRRQFALASKQLDKAHVVITRIDAKREAIIYLEYAGELAYEKGEYFRAKAILNDAYSKGTLLAPNSALISQTVRRLAEVELALDNVGEAMKYAQKALDLSIELGEKAEIAMAKHAIARVFAAQNKQDDANEYIRQALDLLRELGDPYEYARAHVSFIDILMTDRNASREHVRSVGEQAIRLFKQLKSEYWIAETEFRTGMLSCQGGDLGSGFRHLSRAERIFSALDESARVRAVNRLLTTLSEQAVALSISSENEYKIFGNLFTPAEYSQIKEGELKNILEIVRVRTGSDRAIMLAQEAGQRVLVSTFDMTPSGEQKFKAGFERLVGQEISKTRPTLLIDCRRDPFIKELFAEMPVVVACILVVPFTLSDGSSGFLYLDKLTNTNSINTFSQVELNFAVGFSDLIAYKFTEFQKNRLLEDNRRLTTQLMEKVAFPNIITQNREMLDILAQVRQIVNSNISVSIEGETGCGKDLLARAIHFNSDRKESRFISVNCAALPETLLESELFGYHRGAFTGADRDKAGLFEEANGGTFFLDEIGDMPLNVQAKILRVLENKEIVRLGETQPRKVDVRVISATNRDLKELMASGQFRQDLYYRLSALSFRLPPLRERKEDIPLLIANLLSGSGKRLHPAALQKLIAYDWPGNIRELDNEIKKLVLLSGDAEEIGTNLLSTRIDSSACVAPVPITHSSNGNGNGNGSEVTFSESFTLYDYLNNHERRFIMKAMQESGGVKKHAAARLNIPESTLRLKLKQHNIDPDQFAEKQQ